MVSSSDPRGVAPAPPPSRSAGPAAATLAASAGSVLSAFLASACCVGPLVFALLGLGGAGLLVKFAPFRPYFLAVTFGLLGAGFYVTYGSSGSRAQARGGAEGAACGCPAPRTHRAGRALLWVATVCVTAFLIFPYLVPVLFG
ncbi:MAG: mercury transporter MerT [Deltaproteobacteria bacterium]|nr:mercury transporter MerT [Deltaproteobacteria bacterium]